MEQIQKTRIAKSTKSVQNKTKRNQKKQKAVWISIQTAFLCLALGLI